MAQTKSSRRETATMVRATMLKNLLGIVMAVGLILLAATLVAAQTTSFTYQGALSDSGTMANGNYDLQFSLWDSVSGGNQIGSTQGLNVVPVSNGIFSVTLDFGASAFNGAARFLEIRARPSNAGSFTLLTPRQPLTATPYAIRASSTAIADTATIATTAANATQLGGLAANQYVQTNDSRLVDARPPTPGSSSYIQNTQNQQAANFNIAGDGTAGGTLSAGLINTTSNYSINGNTALKISGAGAGQNSNTFTGFAAGTATIPSADINGTGNHNSFFGRSAGNANTTGQVNSFFGVYSGSQSISGDRNAFFGGYSGYNNTSGSFNVFFGYTAGQANTTGEMNSFIGADAGLSNTTGRENVFVGHVTGSGNITGSSITLIGSQANVGQSFLANATAIGAKAQVSHPNSIVLGGINGINNATADTNVGIGTTTPNALFHIAANSGNIVMGHAGCASSFVGLGFGASLSGCTNYSLLGNGTDTIVNRPSGVGIYFRENNITQMSIAPGGAVSITTLGAGGTTSLCRNPSNQISICSSSLRYKTNIQPFSGGLSVLNRLRPITFDWKQGGMHDLGFGAEDIAAVEPLLVTHNTNGEVEGVKYDRITAVLVNAVKEQQVQFLAQQDQIKQQQQLITEQQSQLRMLHQEVITLKQLVTNRRHRSPRHRQLVHRRRSIWPARLCASASWRPLREISSDFWMHARVFPQRRKDAKEADRHIGDRWKQTLEDY